MRKRINWHLCRLLLPKMPGQDFPLKLNRKLFLLFFLSFTLSLTQKGNTIISISQAIVKGVAFQTARFVIKNCDLSINTATLVWMFFAPAGFIFVCGDGHFLWASECLHGWHITGQCLLGYLTVLLTVHKQTETPHWSSPLNGHHWVRKYLSGSIHDSGFASCDNSLLPWLGVNTNQAVIRNLSLTLFAQSTAEAIAAQQRSLDSLAKVVFDCRVVFIFF